MSTHALAVADDIVTVVAYFCMLYVTIILLHCMHLCKTSLKQRYGPPCRKQHVITASAGEILH